MDVDIVQFGKYDVKKSVKYEYQYYMFIYPRIKVDYDDMRRISEMPQHIVDENGEYIANPGWIFQRLYRFTGSFVGSAMGNVPYKGGSSTEAIRDKVFGKKFQGNWKTNRGTVLEPYARDIIEMYAIQQLKKGDDKYESIYIEETGIVVNPIIPWIGVSPDGILHVGSKKKILIEIKAPCPKYVNQYDAKPYKDGVPQYYMDQIQLGMGILGLKECWFVQYFVKEIYHIKVDFDEYYFKEVMIPTLKRKYMTEFVPMLLKKEKTQKKMLISLLQCKTQYDQYQKDNKMEIYDSSEDENNPFECDDQLMSDE